MRGLHFQTDTCFDVKLYLQLLALHKRESTGTGISSAHPIQNSIMRSPATSQSGSVP